MQVSIIHMKLQITLMISQLLEITAYQLGWKI